jgi:acid phosphatase (class A)
MLALAALLLTVESAAAQAGRAEAGGYVPADHLSLLAERIPAAPRESSPEDAADIVASDRLRQLENGDRWLLATRHAELRPAVALAHFDCALGFRIEAADSPRLVSLLSRVLHDANEAAELAKARAHRPRPVAVDPQRAACQVVGEAGRASPSHPSGSASVGAAYGAAMAALVPDKAEALREIGHQIAVSRMVCGMHYPSDVTAGETLGLTVFDVLATSPGFVADAQAARTEIEAARLAGRTSPACAAERAALAIPLP